MYVLTEHILMLAQVFVLIATQDTIVMHEVLQPLNTFVMLVIIAKLVVYLPHNIYVQLV